MDAKATMLAIHIFCGFVALVTMVMAYLTKKGPTMHAKVGRIYGYAMVGVGLTAIVLFFLGASVFLLLIAFFSLYLVLVGWRFATNRKGEVSSVDTALIQLGMGGGVALLAKPFGAFYRIGGNDRFPSRTLFIRLRRHLMTPMQALSVLDEVPRSVQPS